MQQPTVYDHRNVYDNGAGGGDVNGVVKIGKNFYRTVEINGKIWLAENFLEKVGQESSSSGTNPRHCVYGGNYGVDYIWGTFYNWYAVEYIENNKNTICPGWHVPTKSEWQSLINYLNSNLSKLKKNLIWYAVETDDCGISIIPSGYTDNSGSWYGRGSTSVIWTISDNGENAERLLVQANSFNIEERAKTSFLNLRLVKD